MRGYTTLVLALFVTLGFSQVDSSLIADKTEKETFFVAEQMAEFPGGNYAFARYISVNLEYPAHAKENGIHGRVFIQFDIDTSGNVVNAKVMAKRLTGEGAQTDDYGLGQCALDVVAKSPPWIPAMQRGKKVQMRMRVPIHFKLL